MPKTVKIYAKKIIFSLEISVMFLKISITVYALRLKTGIKLKMHISKNMESNLSKKVPNSIFLTEIYRGKNSVSLKFSLNKNNIFAQLNIKKIEDNKIAINDIFISFLGLCSLLGMKSR